MLVPLDDSLVGAIIGKKRPEMDVDPAFPDDLGKFPAPFRRLFIILGPHGLFEGITDLLGGDIGLGGFQGIAVFQVGPGVLFGIIP